MRGGGGGGGGRTGGWRPNWRNSGGSLIEFGQANAKLMGLDRLNAIKKNSEKTQSNSKDGETCNFAVFLPKLGYK